MRCLLVAGVALLAHGQSAGAQTLGRQISNPYCDIATYQNDARVSPGADGTAHFDQGRQVIFVHRSAYQRPWYVRLILAHECAHHALRHVGNTALTRWQKEIDADCWAAQALVRSGDVQTLADILRELPGATKIGRPDEPTVPQRVATIRRCARM